MSDAQGNAYQVTQRRKEKMRWFTLKIKKKKDENKKIIENAQRAIIQWTMIQCTDPK